MPAAATSFTLLVSNSHNEETSEAKNKCGVAKIGGIKLKTKQLKRRWEQIASHKGDRGRDVSQTQNPMLFRYKRITRRNETQSILPDVDVAYSLKAVTYLSEVGVAWGGSFSDGQYYNLPLARRRKLCSSRPLAMTRVGHGLASKSYVGVRSLNQSPGRPPI